MSPKGSPSARSKGSHKSSKLAGIDEDQKLEDEEAFRQAALRNWKPSPAFVFGEINEMSTAVPRDMKVFDLFFDLQTLSWQNWQSVFYFSADQSESRSQTAGKGNMSTVVLTEDVLRTQFLIQRLIHARRPLLLIGPTASGKTTLIRHYLKSQDNVNKMTHLELISCSLAATAARTQQYME